MKIGNFDVHFDYSESQPTIDGQPPMIVCEINSPSGVFANISVCKHGDDFSKRKGRKFAFRNTLRKMPMTKYERAAAWEEYFRVFPKDRKI